MKNHRRAILHLLAIGRITPAEAERLLAVWNDGREGLWVLAACLAAAGLAQLQPHTLLPELVHMFRSMLPAGFTALQHNAIFFTHPMGGIQ